MDEDIANKVAAPVTRMRRRLSEQSDIVNSPSTPSTPTKKKGGRLLSQLDQIDENAPVSRLKNPTKIQTITEATQTVPSPRAQRAARRNSHIDSETEAPLTPARQTRRARKDSTSSTENLKPLTPARVTRKTRRTSTSSTDNQVENVSINKPTIQEAISEEQESNLQQNSLEKTDISKNENISPNSIRKSPRLMAKKDKSGTTDETDFNHKIDSPVTKDIKLESKIAVVLPILNLEETTKSTILMNSSPTHSSTDKSDNMNISKDSNERFSEASFNLIKHLDAVSKKIKSNLNKSTTALLNKKSTSVRHRTKSWTGNSAVVSNNDSNICSDTEYIKKRNKSHEKLNIKKAITEPSPGKALNSVTMQEEKDILDAVGLNKITIMTPECPEVSTQNNKENYNEDHEPNKTIKWLEKTPTKNVKSIVYLEDTDSNTGINNDFINKINDNEDQCVPVIKYQFDKQDKTQPDENISKQNETNKSITNSVSLSLYNTRKNDDSCEPMDVDVTIPECVGIANAPNENKSTDDPNKLLEINTREQEKLSLSNAKESDQGNDNSNKSNCSSTRHSMSSDADKINNENEQTGTKNQQMMNLSMDFENSLKSNKSKRKSSLQHSLSQQMNKSGNDTKSTLVLSQIKDISADENIPNAANITNNNVENPINNSNISKNIKNNKRNVSNNDFSDTPLKQKDINKLGMQTSTPVTNGKLNTKQDTIKTKTPKKEMPTISKTSESELESEEESEDQNNFTVDEAEDAGDDYESGDSQGEDEIENNKYEILEKGETLSSEDEISNDSDYEKDSFIVSSDEEDDELLSGTGDDLSMSDKELTMSAKSKQKYNERKKKEQKKASREMYESRHKVKSSGKSKKKVYPSSSEDDDYTLKAKKKNRLRLESTSKSDIDDSMSKIKKVKRPSESMEMNDAMKENELTTACMNISEENIIVKPENKSRLRLDSITDSTMMKSDVDESVSKKKKQRNKRVSGSYNDSAVNEKEITAINNESIINKTDPLSTLIKVEQLTPQKDNTLSFTYRKEIEEIQVENNISVNYNESVDPLQATVADDDNLSISENEEIKQNFDSILRELNKESKGFKSRDISLNLNKEKKPKNKNPLIDQLNLTQTKQSKNKIKKRLSKETNENTIKNAENESSSDAIDLNLIFPQVSDDNEEQEKNKNNEKTEVFIPLKRTEGKTNISDKDELRYDGSLNESMKKKNKKRKSTDSGKVIEEDETIFFIDTKGRSSHSNTSTHVLVNTSLTNKNMSVDENSDTIKEIDKSEHNNEGPLNESIKKKNKKRKSSLKSSDTGKENEDETIFFIDTKGRRSDSDTSTNVLVNTSLTNKNLPVDETPDTIIEDKNEHDESLNESKKKKNKKRKSSLKASDTDKENEKGETSFFIGGTKGRRTDSDTSTNVLIHTSLTSKHLFIDENPDIIQEIDVTMDEKAEVVKSKKRKRNLSVVAAGDEIVGGIDDSKKEESFANTSQKKKRKTSHRDENIDIENKEIIITEQNVSKPEQASFEKKRKNIVNQAHAQEPPSGDEMKGGNSTGNKQSVQASDVEIMSKEDVISNTGRISFNKKKKKNVENQESALSTKQNSDAVLLKKEKHEIQNKLKDPKISKNKQHSTGEDNAPRLTGNPDEENKTQKINKKRKERDDDTDDVKTTKVLKESSSNFTHVPRLPADILKQLDERCTPKSITISTTKFVVEQTNKKKNKPSNYLEETINLNADSPLIKKNKKRSKKPNVLPFIPTASTSGNGCTTNFKINVIPQEVKFIAQSSDASNFKNDYLYSNKIKRLGTYELYKKHRTIKLSKF